MSEARIEGITALTNANLSILKNYRNPTTKNTTRNNAFIILKKYNTSIKNSNKTNEFMNQKVKVILRESAKNALNEEKAVNGSTAPTVTEINKFQKALDNLAMAINLVEKTKNAQSGLNETQRKAINAVISTYNLNAKKLASPQVGFSSRFSRIFGGAPKIAQ